MLDTLFKFPIVMVDGHKEEEKERRSQSLALDNQPYEVDIIIGEAEVPYYEFVSVTDRWLPTDESFEKALSGKFDACSVNFSHSGSFVVPWPRDKFKKELKAFSEKFSEDSKLIDAESVLSLIKNRRLAD